MDEKTEQEIANTLCNQQQTILNLQHNLTYYRRKASVLERIWEWITYIPSKIPFIVWFCIGLIVVVVGLWVVRSHYEAKTFNAITGKRITTRQALWVQLRVQEPAGNVKEQ